MDSLNVAYEVSESRSWWKKYLVASALTVVWLALMAAGLLFLIYGGRLSELMAGESGQFIPGAWQVLSWLFALGFVVTAFNLVGEGPNSNEASATPVAAPVAVTLTSVAAQDGWVLESGETTNAGGSIDATATTTSALRVGDNMVRAAVPARVDVKVEDAVRFGWDPNKVMLFDPRTGMNLRHKAA